MFPGTTAVGLLRGVSQRRVAPSILMNFDKKLWLHCKFCGRKESMH